MPRVLAALLAAVALGGCGNDRTPPPDVDTPAAPEGRRDVRLREAGVSFRAPGNWPDLPPQGTRAGGVRSGRATVAVFRYPREQELPAGRAELRRVRALLLARVRERDPGFELARTRYLPRGIEIVGRQTISGLPARVRSRHLYARGAEYVIDAYAPPQHFARADRAVFRPLLRSLRLGKPRG